MNPQQPVIIRAGLLFLGSGAPLVEGAVALDSSGVVTDVGPASEVLSRCAGLPVESYAGFVMPGLVNAHTHLELSFLRGKVPGGAGFFPWVLSLLRARAALVGDETPAADNEAAILEMQRAGVVAVGDVTNDLSVVSMLARHGLQGAVFHEVLGVDEALALSRLQQMQLDAERQGVTALPGLSYALSSHTLYTTHPTVVRRALEHSRAAGRRSSLHLAEHPGEEQFLLHGAGPMLDFARTLKLPISAFPVPHLRSIAYADSLRLLAPDVLLVHLTQATHEELDQIAARNAPVVLCPRSNLYIQLLLPPVLAMLQAGIIPALGTDSLASNTNLDVLAEARALHERFSSIPLSLLLEMATLAGAKALGVPGLARLQRGDRPALLQLDVDLTRGAEHAMRQVLRTPLSARRLIRSPVALSAKSG